ncbi:MAG: fibronectin type III domain-containing protein [Steroidobacteraceae bacterium]|nr:fibronectin type III domain-containing protein [Deltaproteobacteria bacterium]
MRQLIKRHIGQILLDGGFLPNRDLDRALEEQKHTKELLGQVLVRMGLLKERDFKVPLIVQQHLGDIDGAVRIAAGERQLLGVLLVHSGHITNQQLDHAIAEQKRSGEKLGEVFMRLGLLSERQLTALLDFQKNQCGATSGPLRLGELLIATGFISRKQLDEALQKQSISHKKLGEVLIDAGYVRPSLVKYGICLQKMVMGSVLAAILSLGMNATSFASSAKFKWDPNTESDLAGYKLHYGVKGEAATNLLDVGLQTTATVNGLDPDNTYDFTVTAYNTSGLESSSSNVVTVLESVLPVVSVSNPLNNAKVNDTVLVQANAFDNAGVAKVEFYVNDVLTSSASAAPYQFYWNTQAVAPGAYNLTAKAFDAAGNAGVSTVSLMVVKDVNPPTVSSILPLQGSSLSGSVNVSCSASDDVGVSKVEFYANGAMVAAVNTAPYNYAWDTTAVANGSYTLTAKAYDAAGNVGQTGNLVVSVSNNAPSAEPLTVLNAAPSAPLDIAHALQALQIAVGILSPTDAQKNQLDVAPYSNGQSVPDGKIDVSDALVILSKVTGKI